MRKRLASTGYAPVLSAFYDRVIAPGTARVTEALLDRVVADLPDGATCVDVGCGGGQGLVHLADLRPDLNLVGVEPSQALAARARERLAGRALVHEAVAEDLPLDDASADLVVSLFSVKHWGSRAVGTAECVPVLRPAGRLTDVRTGQDPAVAVVTAEGRRP